MAQGRQALTNVAFCPLPNKLISYPNEFILNFGPYRWEDSFSNSKCASNGLCFIPFTCVVSCILGRRASGHHPRFTYKHVKSQKRYPCGLLSCPVFILSLASCFLSPTVLFSLTLVLQLLFMVCLCSLEPELHQDSCLICVFPVLAQRLRTVSST